MIEKNLYNYINSIIKNNIYYYKHYENKYIYYNFEIKNSIKINKLYYYKKFKFYFKINIKIVYGNILLTKIIINNFNFDNYYKLNKKININNLLKILIANLDNEFKIDINKNNYCDIIIVNK